MRRNVVIVHRKRQVSRADELVVMTLDRMRYLGSGRGPGGVLVKCQAGGSSSAHQKDGRSFTPPIEMQGTESDCQICRGFWCFSVVRHWTHKGHGRIFGSARAMVRRVGVRRIGIGTKSYIGLPIVRGQVKAGARGEHGEALQWTYMLT